MSYVFFSSPLAVGAIQGDVMVRGTVVDEESDRAVAGAVVYAISGADVLKSVSDPRGHFFFLTLLPGDYCLCASKGGYESDCAAGDTMELRAGFEYGATVVLSRATH